MAPEPKVRLKALAMGRAQSHSKQATLKSNFVRYLRMR